MGRLHFARLGILIVLVTVVSTAWALAEAGPASADTATWQVPAIPVAQATRSDAEPPTVVLVPDDEEARDAAGLPDLAWAGIALLLGISAFGLGRLTNRRETDSWVDVAKRLWRSEAEIALPEPEVPCMWACKVKAKPGSLRSWAVKRILLIPVLGPDAPGAESRIIDDVKLLAPLNDIASLEGTLAHETMIEHRLLLLSHALVARVMSWSQEGCPPAAFRVEAELSFPIAGHFELYESIAVRSGVSWGKPLLVWDDPAKRPGTSTLGLFLGPKANELDFPGRLQEELGASLVALVRTARWLE
jgi:hypothetical protein